MNYFLRLGAYLLHPLLMPLLGTLLYFVVTPRYVETELLQSRLVAVAIITICIPIVVFFLLRNLGTIKSIHLENVHERRVPLAIQCGLLVLIIKLVFDPMDSPEMYFFFMGILFSAMSALILAFLKFRISLHQMGIAGVTMFLIIVSVHFKINMLIWICIFFIGNGWVASSRLHTNSHTYPELIGGFFIGFMPQLLLVPLWL
ncbi:hypothetical protein [Marinirhabdus gelatinilytica]|uniref:PAP2 superfamily protein n=1 Tax=Marinirhabdus gelatinilytica TaxID=1703343 RepID=A0A370QIT0_9FLAO|nr:hypothetical protein [Marinirhabdus gelatinilytica]RDK88273.1 hypothetical protein C8D94_101142 [Marinirhabdus gelatinilytica]